MKRYYLKTQKDYDNLMSELERQGYRWSNGERPTETNLWTDYGKNTYVLVCETNKRIRYGGAEYEVVQYEAEKVVVPQFVADYIENHCGTKPDVWDKADLIRDFDMYLESYGNWSLQKWVKNDDNFLTLIKAIITNDYEVEEEKKYYWRKKKEYAFGFEHQHSRNYLNLDGDNKLFFSDKAEYSLCTTKFTETKVKQLVGEEDFDKLERVEI